MERVGEVGREADFQLAPGAAKAKAAFSQVEQGRKEKKQGAPKRGHFCLLRPTSLGTWTASDKMPFAADGRNE